MTRANASTADVVPNRAQLDAARQLTCDLLNQACGLADYARVMADTYPAVMHDTERLASFAFALETWRAVAVDSFGRLDALTTDASRIVTPLDLYYDRFSSGPLTISRRTYPNAHTAAVEIGRRILVTTSTTRTALSGFTAVSYGREDPVGCLAGHAGDLRDGAVKVIGSNYADDVTAWLALIRLESAKAMSALPPPTPFLSGMEQMIVDALRRHGQPLTQEKLLDAAKLGVTGSNKALLAAMRERGVVNNKGKGYSLPEWGR